MNSKSYFGKRRKILSVWLAAIMAVSLFPMLPQKEVKAYNGSLSPLTLTSGTYILDNVTIMPSPAAMSAGITINGDVTLNITGTNKISGSSQSGYSYANPAYAGINVPSGSTLTIRGSGTLIAIGGNGGDGYFGTDADYGIGPTSGPGYGGGGGGAGIGGNGGRGGTVVSPNANPSSGQTSGTIIIRDSVTVNATGGSGGDGGDASIGGNTLYGGGGGGYPAAGIGGGGAGGGAAYLGGGGGFSGGGGGGYGTGGTSGYAGTASSLNDCGGGGGYLSGSSGSLGGSIGGGAGRANSSYATPAQDGGRGGGSGNITVENTAKVTATNGNGITFNRGAGQSVKGIGSGAGYTEPASGSYIVGGIPNAPTGLGLSANYSNKSITLRWNPSSGATVVGYEISRKTGMGSYSVIKPSCQDLSYIDSNLSVNTTYTYRIRAYSDAGYSGYSEDKSVLMYGVPSAPTITVTPGDKSNTISWTAPADNGATITNYEVFQNGASIGTTTSMSMTKTGLANGTSYSYTVRAYNAAGWGNQSAAASGVPRTVPGAPNTPSLSPGNGQMTISWTAPANNGATVTNYEVFQNNVSIGTTNNTTMTKVGLTNGTNYSYTVRAYNAAGWGAKSAAASAAPRTVPSAPGAPTVSPGNGQNVISWTAPANGGSAVTKYELKRGSTVLKSDITGTSYTDTGLSNGTSYSYTVRAYNAAGWSGFSAATAGTPRTVPAAPAITATAGNKQNTITWSAPANNGAGVTKYEISRKTGTGAYTVLNANVTATSYTDPSLTAGTAYTYRVRAYNAAGWGNYSAEKSASPYTVPNAPGAPTVSPGNGQNVISWTAPANGGSAVTKYELKRGSTVVKSDITGTSYTDTGLVNGTSYSYTVRAYNAAGWGGFSAATAGTPRTVPAAPAITATAGNKQNTITWSAPANNGAGVTKYEISRKTGSGAYAVLNANVTATSYTDPSLTAGTAYTYRVRAYNAAGWGNYSAEKSASPYTVPNAPSAPTVSPGNGQNVISWTAPANNGAAITNYEVFQNGTSIGTTTSTTMTKTGLSNGTSYSYTVRAYNVAGWGNQSAAASAIPRTLPNAPAKPSVTPGDGKNTVTWAAPAANGAAVTAYELLRNGVTISSSITSTSYVDSGLQNGTEYTYTVKAKNVAGWSSASPTSDKAIPYGLPDKVGKITLKQGNKQIKIDWSAADSNGADIESYEIYRNGESLKADIAGDATSYTDTGLTNGTAYTYKVRAHNKAGDGAFSDDATLQLDETPKAPTNVIVTPVEGGFDISWTAADVNGGSDIKGYNVYIENEKNNTELITDTKYSVRGLENGLTYNIQLTAVNKSDFESEKSELKNGVPSSVPAAPQNLVAESGNKEINLVWDAPNANGGNITGYEVYMNDGTGDQKYTSKVTNLKVKNLVNGTAYTFYVKAINKNGSSEASASVTVKAGMPLTPGNFTVTPKNQAFDVSFEAAEGNGSAVQYKIYIDGTYHSTVDSTSATISSMENGMAHRVQVSAVNAVGESEKTKELTVVCGAPTVPNITSVTTGENNVTMTWTASQNNGNRMVGYNVYVNDGTTENKTTAAADATTVTVPDLEAGIAYKITMTAENIAGESARSQEYIITLGAPGAPVVTTVTAGNGSAVLEWTAPTENAADITGYNVYVDGNLKMANIQGTTATVQGLANGRTYKLQVAAVNAKGVGRLSEVKTVVPYTGASAPRNVVATATGATTATITWQEPISNGGSQIVGYKVECPGVDTINVPSGEIFSTTISGLTEGTKYVFTVTAINGADENPGTESNEITTWAKPSAASISSLESGSKQVTVFFGAPAEDGGSRITGYNVYMDGKKKNANPVSDEKYTITGLQNGMTYTLAATAINSVGEGEKSLEMTVTVGTPSTPKITSIVPGDSSFTIDWEKSDSAASTVTGYKIFVDGKQKVVVPGENTTTYEMAGLTNGQTYKIQLSATNAWGDSPLSKEITIIPGTPLTPTLDSVTAGKAAIDVAWTAPQTNGGNIGKYVVYVESDNEKTAPYTVDVAGTATSTKLTGLIGGDTYKVSVSAVNDFGEGKKSNELSAMPWTEPDAPKLVDVASGDRTYTVTWEAPAENGKPVQEYYIYLDNDKVATVDAGSTTKTIEAFTGTEGNVTVSAKNEGGEGPKSEAKHVKVGVPTTPQITAVTLGDGQVTLAWSQVNPNGSLLSGYQIYVDGEKTGEITKATTAIIPNLKNGQEYTLQVSAINIIGESELSDQVKATPGVTNAPVLVMVTEGDGQVRLVWDRPQGAESNLKYNIYMNGNYDAYIKQTTDTSVIISGLENGTEYTFEVTADNGIGESAKSNAKTATPFTKPSAPTGVVATPNGTEKVTVTWQAPANDGGRAIDSYKVVADGVAQSQITVDNETLTATVTGLESGTTYAFQVMAHNDAGDSAAATAEATTYEKPAAPVLVFADPGNAQVTLEWEPGASKLAAAADLEIKYNVYMDGELVTKDSETGEAQPITDTTYTVKNLTNGVKYEFTVTAVNEYGESNSSNRLLGKPTGNWVPVKPDAPTDVQVTPGDKTLTISWKAPANNGGSTITGYNVYVNDSLNNAQPVTDTTYTVQNVENGREYKVQITAINAQGEGTKTTEVKATPNEPTVINPPSAPKNLRYVTYMDSDNAKIVWDVPENNGGAAVTGYHVYLNNSATPNNDAAITTQDYTITAEKDTAYVVTAAAENSAGIGTKSSAIKVVGKVNIDTNGDGKPDINKDIDGDGKPDINIDKDGDGTPDINIDTTVPPNDIPDVNIDTNGDGKPDINIDTTVPADNIPDVNIDTDGDKKPDINVDINGDGKPDVNIDTDGDKKPDINIDKDGDGKPEINVDTDGDGEADINIDTDGDGFPDKNVDVDGDGVPDINVDGKGDDVPSVVVPTPPNAPKNLRAVSDGAGSITIKWDEPDGSDVSPVKQYMVYIDGDISYTAVAQYQFDATEGKTYKINVSATTVIGGKQVEGALAGPILASLDINVDTSGDGEADDKIDNNGDGVEDNTVGANPPYAPVLVSVVINADKNDPSNRTMTIKWTAPENNGGSEITGYTVYNGNSPIADTTTETQTVITPVEGTDYKIAVSATNSEGEGGKSNVILAKWDINIDTDGDGKADVNVDTNGDGKPNINVDTDGDLDPDINIDTDGDGKPNINVDIDGDGEADINKDTNGDGHPDTDIDVDGDGKADINKDTDGDGKPDDIGTLPPQNVTSGPGLVTGLTYISKPDGHIIVTWVAPENSGGSAITGYNVFVNGIKTTDSPITGTTYTFEATANTLYTIEVSAINATDEGGKSTPVKAKNHLNLDTNDDGTADSNLDVDFDGVQDEAAEKEKVKITGTLDLRENKTATITLYGTNDVVIATKSGYAAGAFEFAIDKPETADTIYKMVISTPGYTKSTVTNIKLTGDVAIPEKVVLNAGDFDDDDGITVFDITKITKYFNAVGNTIYDVDGDGGVTVFDITAVTKNFNKVAQEIVMP